jgi:hypothetical protein
VKRRRVVAKGHAEPEPSEVAASAPVREVPPSTGEPVPQARGGGQLAIHRCRAFPSISEGQCVLHDGHEGPHCHRSNFAPPGSREHRCRFGGKHTSEPVSSVDVGARQERVSPSARRSLLLRGLLRALAADWERRADAAWQAGDEPVAAALDGCAEQLRTELDR